MPGFGFEPIEKALVTVVTPPGPVFVIRNVRAPSTAFVSIASVAVIVAKLMTLCFCVEMLFPNDNEETPAMKPLPLI